MMQIKEGVSLLGLDSKMILAFIIADQVYSDNGINDCVLTAGVDGKHMEHSLHGKGFAIDLRTSNIQPYEKIKPISVALQAHLGIQYQVILESDHIHVEFDPK